MALHVVLHVCTPVAVEVACYIGGGYDLTPFVVLRCCHHGAGKTYLFLFLSLSLTSAFPEEPLTGVAQ